MAVFLICKPYLGAGALRDRFFSPLTQQSHLFICEFVYSSIFSEQLVNLRSEQVLQSRGNNRQHASALLCMLTHLIFSILPRKATTLAPLYGGGTEAQGTQVFCSLLAGELPAFRPSPCPPLPTQLNRDPLQPDILSQFIHFLFLSNCTGLC